MPNIASLLKEEITRLARKELRIKTEQLKKASTQHRSDIAALKRRVATLEQQVFRLVKMAAKTSVVPVSPEEGSKIRFTAKGFAAQRQRLGLSAADMGTLIGVSAQTVYNWESEKSSPREMQMAGIAAVRKFGKNEASARLAARAE